jgi:hypothetical protein
MIDSVIRVVDSGPSNRSGVKARRYLLLEVEGVSQDNVQRSIFLSLSSHNFHGLFCFLHIFFSSMNVFLPSKRLTLGKHFC